ncbi:MAG TPA: adenylate/guanylate cyclase domain-containing protein [Usitatibacter sp.]|nr:adenylate/guanylate cyclase domain-containing protein [Usitatibacter sp.]
MRHNKKLAIDGMQDFPAETPPPAPASSARHGQPVLSPEEKLSGDMLMLTTGFMMCAAALWLAVYWSMGYQYSTAIPLVFQALSVVTIGLWWKLRRLYIFAVVQLGLILFTPFAMQWSIGNFVTASGVSLWGLMAPVGAVTVLGTRQSMPWFFAWLFMTVMAGFFDFMITGVVTRIDLQTVAVFFVLNFAAISVMIYSLLWYFAAEKQKLRTQVDAQHQEILLEKERSEKLLLNVLPPAIAERLKRNEVNIAQGHADVTVMFADIVGFTRMTEELSPVETVKILNDVFSIFDDIADKHRVEKIKTIGDAYMACAGLDTGAQIHYADAVANMALEMIARVDDYRKRTGERVQIRIGIGTGPVVAGVIGKKKFIYDMWGDTVNVAFRLAADALPETVQVDLVTHRRLYNRFRFNPARELEIKGKGRMQVFELAGAAERSASAA